MITKISAARPVFSAPNHMLGFQAISDGNVDAVLEKQHGKYQVQIPVLLTKFKNKHAALPTEANGNPLGVFRLWKFITRDSSKKLPLLTGSG